MPTQQTSARRVFVTGASGFIGSAIVRVLLDGGYEVTGLARSETSADDLRRRGLGVHRGDVTDPESLAAGARAADAVIHTAFIHDFSDYVENTKTDERAVLAIAEALEGPGVASDPPRAVGSRPAGGRPWGPNERRAPAAIGPRPRRHGLRADAHPDRP